MTAACRLAAGLLVLALSVPAASAADLSMIDRRIAREPAYLTKMPKYCLLVFGLKAKARVWVVVDQPEGKAGAVYVDRNGNGDLTEEGERVPVSWGSYAGELGAIPAADDCHSFAVEELKPRGSQPKHCTLRMREVRGDTQLILRTPSGCWQYVGYDEEADPFRFGDCPGDAPVVHFAGPLEVRLFGPTPTFVRGKTSELNVKVGTPGAGKGTFAALGCCHLPGGSCLAAEVEFPPRSGKEKPFVARVKIEDD